jgi:hypothetical protein
MFWSVVAVAGAALAMGKYTGSLANALYHVPLISHFRSPNRHWMEVTMAVAVLAGYAMDRLLKENSRFLARCAWVSSVVLALLCCAVGGFALWQKGRAENLIRALTDLHQLPPGFLASARWEFLLPMIAAVVACVALVIFIRAQNRTHWFVLLLAVLIVDFNLYAAFAPINNPAKLETLIGRAMPPALAARQNERVPIRYHIMLSPTTGEFSPFWFYGHEMMPGYDPVLTERQKIFSGVDEAGRCFNQTMLDEQDRTLDLFNVRYVFVPPGDRNSLAMGTSARWRELGERSPAAPYREYRVYENLRALPRAWLTTRARVAYEGDQLKLIRGQIIDPDFDPRTTALVDHETAAKLDKVLLTETSNADADSGNASILRRRPTTLLVEADAAKSSLLVMSEMFYPGWTAKLDGKEVDLWRVNYNLRGVLVPTGKHIIELNYRPRALVEGAVVSLATALCLLAILIFEKKQFKGADVVA